MPLPPVRIDVPNRIPVRIDVPNPIPVQPPVGGAQGPVNNAPVGNPPAAPELPGEDPQAQEPRTPARELVAKLDSLLVRAATTATASVDAAALEAAAGTAKLDEPTRQELSGLAESARTSFAALAAFTGRQIGNALALENGAFDWKEEDPVATAIKKALDDQAKLAEKLHELVNRPEIKGDASDSLCELAAYTREIRESSNALARAGREGIRVGEGGSRVMPDRQLLDAAATVLRGLEERLAGIRREVVRKAAGDRQGGLAALGVERNATPSRRSSSASWRRTPTPSPRTGKRSSTRRS